MSQNDNIFWPRKIKIIDVLMTTAGAFIAWVIGSVLLLFIVFLFGWIIDIPSQFKWVTLSMWWNNPLFPFVLSFITFVVSVIVAMVTYYFLTIIDSEKYKKTIIHFWQISFFAIIIYIIFIPVYVVVGMNNYNAIMYVFILHILLLSFWEILILELLNNYRYILLWVYASFFWLWLSAIAVVFIFSLFWDGYAKLLSLLLILPLSNACMLFFKGLFDLLYYQYFMVTGKDQLGDIFEQIKQEDIDEYNQAASESNLY